jgi:hypothetical protein
MQPAKYNELSDCYSWKAILPLPGIYLAIQPCAIYLGLKLEAPMEQKKGPSPETCHLEGRYANYFEVGYNAFEFLLDFGQHYPESANGCSHTRIVTIPSYARAFLETLQESIDKYEQTFGPIKET